jgi:hypothetical protein
MMLSVQYINLINQRLHELKKEDSKKLTKLFDLKKRQIENILKELESANLIKRTYGTANNGKRNIGNSLFLQLIPPHPYRFLKGEFFQSRIKSIGNSKLHEIILTKIRDIHDYDFEQDCHFISHSTQDAELNKALDGMERDFDFFFVAEVKISDKGNQWLDHNTHFTNDWLMRDHIKEQEELVLDNCYQEEVTPPPAILSNMNQIITKFMQ